MSNRTRNTKGFILAGGLFILLFLVSAFIQDRIELRDQLPPMTLDELYEFDGIKDIHITLTDSSWIEMQPFGGPFGLPDTVFWLDLGRMWAPIYLRAGDVDRDGLFTREEFIGLAEKWFSDWDSASTGELDMDLLEHGYLKSTDGGLSLQGPIRNGIARVFGVQTPTTTADLIINELLIPSVSIRYKGNGTLMDTDGLKKSIKIDLNDGFKGRKLAGVTKMNFQNQVTDAGYMNDALAYKLYRDAGVPSPRTSYAKVFMSVQDSLDYEYLGLYLLLENVDNNFAKSWYGTEKGVIFKPVTPQLFEYLGDNWNHYIKAYEPKTPLSIQESNRIMSLCKLVTNGSESDFEALIGEYVDLENFARYMAVTTFITDLDGILGPGQNMYMYLHPKTYKLSFIAWDHDHSFGQMRGTQEEREQLSLDKPWMFNNRFLKRMFELEDFKKLYLQYMSEFNQTIFQPQEMINQIDHLAKLIRPAVAQESSEILKEFDFKVGWNGLAYDPLDSAEKVDPRPLRSFVANRHKSITEQLSGESKGMIIKGGYIPKGIFGRGLMQTLDLNRDTLVTKQEMVHAYDSVFTLWLGNNPEPLPYQAMIDGMNANWNSFGPDPRKRIKNDSLETKITNQSQ